MSDTIFFEPTTKQFGPFYKYMEQTDVTDVDFNGNSLWITDSKKGRYQANEEISEEFLTQFIHDIANCINKPFNRANRILEADTKEYRISIVHDSVAISGTSICIRKSPPMIKNTIDSLLESKFCDKEILHLLVNCVLSKMNFVIGGEPNTGKTETAKFLMQFIPKQERVITIEDSLELHYGEINPNADHVELRIDKGFSYTDAIKTCLRQNPKWIVLSEARSVEVASLLEQWSTGVSGFSTIHLNDMKKLPDRILNMMDQLTQANRMENRIYESVDVGILVRCVKKEDQTLFRYIDQLYFFSREHDSNCLYPIVEDGMIKSKELPDFVRKKFEQLQIKHPFQCSMLNRVRGER